MTDMRRMVWPAMMVLIVAACGDRPAAGDAAAADASPVVAEAGPNAGTLEPATADTIEVWKDPNCGCCRNWVEHMRKHGFTVVIHDTPDLTPVKQTHGVGADLAACHTAVIDGYVVEGHVPADLVQKLLKERPAIAGLAVPGMPMGSPGMESDSPQHYDVIAFNTDGTRSVYASR